MYGCESWTIKKAEYQRIDAFELWCWRRLLRVTWTARRSNQSNLKGISPEYSFERPMLMLKANTLATWCEELTHLKRSLWWERLRAGGEAGCGGVVIEDEMVGWHHWLNGHEFEQALGIGDGQRSLAYCSLWGRKESDMTEWLNWTEPLELFIAPSLEWWRVLPHCKLGSRCWVCLTLLCSPFS